jgi:hypothetical protein
MWSKFGAKIESCPIEILTFLLQTPAVKRFQHLVINGDDLAKTTAKNN